MSVNLPDLIDAATEEVNQMMQATAPPPGDSIVEAARGVLSAVRDLLKQLTPMVPKSLMEQCAAVLAKRIDENILKQLPPETVEHVQKYLSEEEQWRLLGECKLFHKFGQLKSWRKREIVKRNAGNGTIAEFTIEICKEWHPNKQLKAYGKMVNGKKCGKWRRWDEDGKELKSIEEPEEDLLEVGIPSESDSQQERQPLRAEDIPSRALSRTNIILAFLFLLIGLFASYASVEYYW